MSIEDQPTQQIHRPQTPVPMPGPLNPASATPPAPAESTDRGSTEVLSLDELLDAPAREAPVTSTPVTSTPVTSTPVTSSPSTLAPRIGAVPVASTQRSTSAGGSRLRGDAATAWRSGLDRSRSWLTAGDNAVIAATVLIALLLLLAVALF